MPNEQEELKLTVTLVDNASAGIDKIQEKLKELGGGSGQALVEKFKRDNAEITNVVKKMTGEMGEAFKSLGMLRLGFAGGAAGLAMFGYELAKQITKLSEYTDKLRAVNQAAKLIGVDPSSIRNIQEQLKVFGVSADDALQGITAFSDKMAELQRNPAFRMSLMNMTGNSPQSAAAMNDLLNKLSKAKDIREQLNLIREAGENAEKHALERHESRIQAANDKQKLWAQFNYDPRLSLAGQIKAMTEEQRIADEQRIKNAEIYSNKIGEITSKWDLFVEHMKTPLLGPDSPLLWTLNRAIELLDAINEKASENEKIGRRVDKETPEPEGGARFNPLDQRNIDREKRLLQERRIAHPEIFGQPGASSFSERFEESKKATKENSDQLRQLNEYLKAHPGTLGPASPAGYTPAAYHPDSGVRTDPGASFRRGGASVTYGPNGSSVGPGTGRGAGATAPGTPGVGSFHPSKGGDPRGLEGYIRETATKYGVDPDTAVKVASTEGLSRFDSGIRGETSWGAFQLHTGGGLGDDFRKETGLDPSDPKNERATIDWALKNVHRTGWGPYHGAANNRIGSRAGLGGPYGQTAGPGTGAGAGEYGGTVKELQSKIAGIRRGALAAPVRSALDYASAQTGLTVEVGSGGQRMEGAPGATGSHRHDGGMAADFKLRDSQGNLVNINDPRAINFYRAAARAGMAGGGAAHSYMGDYTTHLDPGHRGGVYAGSGEFRTAIAEGHREFLEKGMPAARSQIDKSQVASTKVEGSGKLSVRVDAPKGTYASAEGGGLFKNIEMERLTQGDHAKQGPAFEMPR